MTFELDTVFVWVSDVEQALDWYAKLGIQAGERYGSWQNMRVKGEGPPYYKFGRLVKYEVEVEVPAWAAERRRESTSQTSA